MSKLKNRYAYILTIITLFTLQTILSACATQPKEEGAEQLAAAKYLLTPSEMKLPGFYHNKDTSVFESELLRVSVRQPAYTAKLSKGNFLKKLQDQSFIFLKMDIENKGDKLIIYNPAHTSFLSGLIDYKKPLDYTDLYRIASSISSANDELPELQLSKIRDLFYDLNTRIPANSSVSKIFIFYPAKEPTKSGTLTLREIYVGTETIDLAFPFKMEIVQPE